MPYRKASCIELHDAHTALTTNDNSYALTALTGRGVQASRPAFLLRLADAAALGLKAPVEVEEESLPLFRAYTEVPADVPGVQIVSLECDVHEANLVEIRIESRVEGTAPHNDNDVQVVTYSGAFTIWWAAERQVDAEQMRAVAEAHPSIPVGADPEIGVITPAESPIEVDLEDLTGPEVNPP